MKQERPNQSTPANDQVVEALEASCAALRALELMSAPAASVGQPERHIEQATTLIRETIAALEELSKGGSPVIGIGRRLALRDAVLMNGILIHGLDFDDTHLESIIHPTATSLPVALSLGEALGTSGADLLTAFLAGVETSIRTGGAVTPAT